MVVVIGFVVGVVCAFVTPVTPADTNLFVKQAEESKGKTETADSSNDDRERSRRLPRARKFAAEGLDSLLDSFLFNDFGENVRSM